ncbi:hypothetical protein RND81_05G054800 [Saponaria officinalis]|uniref:BZIP domain-containing protein n=1 Tax=Saponaria officinalis TaxID=3572 RepID=A0AAW1KQH5_SAPOF
MTFSFTSDGLPGKAKPSKSSASDGTVDEKKRRRMESNRESARRSRQKKQQHLDGLIKQVGSLTRENDEFRKKISELTALFAAMDARNEVLKAEKDRLATRLEALENTIEIASAVKGSSSSQNGEVLYEVSDDPMMKPWKLPRYSLPIAASSGFGCFDFDD